MSCGTSGRTRLRDLGVGDAADRRNARADEAVSALLVDDVRPVGERVQAEGIEVEVATVLRVAGEDAAVAVADARQGSDAHELDEQLVLRQLVGACRRGRRRLT